MQEAGRPRSGIVEGDGHAGTEAGFQDHVRLSRHGAFTDFDQLDPHCWADANLAMEGFGSLNACLRRCVGGDDGGNLAHVKQ